MLNSTVYHRLIIVWALLVFGNSVSAQDKQDPPEVLMRQTDAKQVLKNWFSKGNDTTANKKHSNFSTLPSAGFNPSVGFAVGVTSTAGVSFGNPKTTTLSVLNANIYVSTKKLVQFEIKNNVFTNNDTYNIQGGLQVGRTVALDYGVGTGHRVIGEGSFSLDGLSLSNNQDIFPIQNDYIKFSERIYREIFEHFYIGAGFTLNSYKDIDDERKKGPNVNTHNFRYSMINNFPSASYNANGLLFNVEYNSRDQINRPYRGLYIDVVLRTNERWMHSNASAYQLKTELRKYWSLSTVNPEHVLAFWFWGNYLLSGRLPYLELPGTGSDQANRMGRGYTIGRFKGNSFMFSEMEYRFPITKNKLISGVAFANAQSASSQRNNINDINLMEFVEPGGGVGLRLLFNKYTRSNLCIDYAVGSYGSKGLFIGLNEVF